MTELINDLFQHRLPNGLRILFMRTPAQPVTHCALMIPTGTRDEPQGKEGLAHFIEHTLFKGTTHRKSFHILSRLEVVGGELNAYTTKEETCLHASVMKQHFERATDLLADIILHSLFPDKEIEKEKDVIIDEIRSYQDTPYEQIFDDFEGQVYKKHPLGIPILGTEESIRKFKRKDLLKHLAEQYQVSEMIFSVSGDHNPEEVFRLAEKYFSVRSKKNIVRKRMPFRNYRKSEKVIKNAVNQVHYIAGQPAYQLGHPKRFELVLLNNLLGGPGMNSLLNLHIRERFGYTYTIESGYHAFSDGGIFHVYFATDQKNFKKVKSLLKKELDLVSNKVIGDKVFRQYQEQLTGQILMGQENRLSLMLSITKGLLYYNRVMLPGEVLDRIRAVKPQGVLEVAQHFFGKDTMSELIYEPSA